MDVKTKILILGPSWVGDMVMSQSLYRLLKNNAPDVTIDVLAPLWCLDLVKRMPEVRKGIALPILHGTWDFKTRYRLAKTLRQEQYDQAIVLPNSWKSALIPWLARIPLRTGWRGEFRYGLLNDIRILDKAAYPLMVQRFMALGLHPKQELPTPCNPSLLTNPTSVQASLTQCALSAPTQPILALAPGAAFGDAKRWPADSFAEVARTLQDQGWQVWIFGSRDDEPILQQIHRMTGSQALCFGQTIALDTKIDLLSLATVIVSNDSGLLHIGAALNVPTLGIYGSTTPHFTPPLGDHTGVLEVSSLACRPCFQRNCPLKGDDHLACLKLISPQQVLTWINTHAHLNH